MRSRGRGGPQAIAAMGGGNTTAEEPRAASNTASRESEAALQPEDAPTRRPRTRRIPRSPREPGIWRLNVIPVQECGEPLVDVRHYCRGLKVRANPSLLRQSAADMLQRAQDALPEGYGMQVNTALRTHETQSRGYFGHLEKLREAHPEWSFSILRREANRFWHPPDQKVPPGHCTGGAVDVTLVNSEGVEYDLRSTRSPQVDSNPTYVIGLTDEARRNRGILIKVMESAGFSNCADEWWHWSYGDNGWAARVGAAAALFGAAPYTQEMLDAATVEEPKEPAEGAAESGADGRETERA